MKANKLFTILSAALIFVGVNASAQTYTNGFKDGGTSTDADYYQEPSLVDGYYQIANAGNLFWFANQVNAGNATYNAKVTKDIDMDGTNHTDFPGIGYYHSSDNTQRKAFSGNFDGGNHRIYNCNITTNNSSYWGSGLIAYATGSGKTIKDFTLEGTVTAKCGARAGGVLGYIAEGYTISGITSSVTINSTTFKTGGLAGFVNKGTVNKCRFNGTINNTNKWTAGLVAEFLNASTMSNCLFDGTINATNSSNNEVGGIAGVIGNSTSDTINNCLSFGTISTQSTGSNTCKVFAKVAGPISLTNVFYGAQGSSTPTIDYANPDGKIVTGSVATLGDYPDWDAIEAVLNADGENWGINSKDYPVPGETDGSQIVKYTIRFVDWNGTELSSRKVKENVTIEAPANPTRTGYRFTGWDPALTESSVANQDQTYTAQYSINSYTITYYVDNVQYGDPDTYEYGATVTARAYPEGNNFSGWIPSVPATMPANDLNIYGTFATYTNGFNDDTSCSESLKYEAPTQITAARCAELVIAATYATDGYFEVKNAGNMFWISKNFSSEIKDRKYVMTADIDMAGNVDAHKDWAGIATTYNADGSTHFQGVFDGLGHKFTNYYMKVVGGDRKSMFGIVQNATIKNFSIDGQMDITSNGMQYGVVVGRVNGTSTLTDIHSSVNITVADDKTPRAIGGIVGQCSNTTVLKRCRYSGTIEAKSAFSSIGGILGNNESTTTITDCLFDGSISSTSTATMSSDADGIRIGGLGGSQVGNGKTTIANCLVAGSIIVNSSSEAVGENSHSGIVFGDNSTTATFSISNTFYITTSSTSGLNAVGLNKATDQTVANPVEKTSEMTWESVYNSLGTSNWLMTAIQDYPVPGVFVCPGHEYNEAGWCIHCDQRKPLVQDAVGTYLIDCLAQFASFRDLVNQSGGAVLNAKLTNDMNFSLFDGYLGDPIGDDNNPYVGTFDGQGHNITGIHIESSKHYVGLFGNVGKDGDDTKVATIKNFSISGTIKTTYAATIANACKQAHMGVVGRLYNGSVECISSSVVFTNGVCTAAQFGGVVGCTYGSVSSKVIKNCQFTGSISVDAWDCVAGIVGYTQGNVEIESNYFGGCITINCEHGKDNILGGILGYGGVDGRKMDMKNNVSNGTLSGASTGTTTTGLLFAKSSALSGSDFSGNYVNGDLNAAETAKGGVTKATTITINDAANYLGAAWRAVDNTTLVNNIESSDNGNYVFNTIVFDDTKNAPAFPSDATSIKAKRIVYSRSTNMTGGLISVCLPFALTRDMLTGTAAQIYTYSGVNAAGNVVLYPADHVDAGTACFICGVNNLSIDSTDNAGIEVVASPANYTDNSDGCYGAFNTTLVGEGYYKINAEGNKLLRTTSTSHCYPYRAYMKLPTTVGSVKSIRRETLSSDQTSKEN